MKQRILFFFLISALAFQSSFTQCSDAGVCSIGQQSADAPHQVALLYLFGKSSKADSLTFHSFYLSASIQVFDESRLSVSLPVNRQSGPLGSTTGVGDLTVLLSQTILHNPTSHLGFEIGGKLTISDVNAKGLPQAYQSGLGTNDLLVGATWEYTGWNFAAAYQFSQERSPNKVDRLKRGDDILLRVGYSEMFGGWKIGGEILAIKRLSKSSVLASPAGQPEIFVDLPESDQAQINLLGRATYRLGDQSELQGMVAFPTLKRNVNVDGLTRSLSLSVGIAYHL